MAAQASAGDVFARATLRLAALFAVIVVLLIAASGIILYESVSTDLHNVITASPASGESELDRVNQSVGHLRLQLIVVDGAIIIAVGAVGLWYARRTLRPIRDNVAAQSRFMADASHELRTPLAIMKADIEVALRGGQAGETAQPVLESGLEEVDRMSVIVDDLLTLSRIDAHQEELRFTEVDVAELVRGAAAELQMVAQRGGVALAMAAPGEDVIVSGDPAHLERALRNVIKNAVEASPRGGAVSLSVGREGANVRIAVSDEGAGIAAHDLEHIFERFYRTEDSRSRGSGGSGLGLSIVQWTLHRHGGEIHTVSVLGEGTTMTISLPAVD
jgi:two-component system, OmpR family, sensor histidine kinase CiaH